MLGILADWAVSHLITSRNCRFQSCRLKLWTCMFSVVACSGTVCGAPSGLGSDRLVEAARARTSSDSRQPRATQPLSNDDLLPSSLSLVSFQETIESFPLFSHGLSTVTITDLPPQFESKWRSQVDSLVLLPSQLPSRTYYTKDTPPFTPALGSTTAGTPVGGGARYALMRNVGKVSSIEANYFRVESFSSAGAVPSSDAQYAMVNLAGLDFEDIDTASFTSGGRIQSFELNWREVADGPLIWLAGFRWVEWNQQLQLSDTYSGGGTVSGADFFQTNTGNNLYGGQIGADLLVWNDGGWLTINTFIKSCAYLNADAYQRTRATAIEDGVTNPRGVLAASRNQASFVGEVGALASLHLTDWLTLRAGYMFFAFTGIADPNSQLSLTNFNNDTVGINTASTLFLQGGTAGVEVRW